MIDINEFDAIRIGLASSKQIRDWSSGEVTKPETIGYLLDIAPRELEKVLYFAASIVTQVDNEARAKDLNDLEDKVKAEGERIYVDRDEQLAELEKRLARRRAFFSESKEKGFDEDDDLWTPGLATWAREQALPPPED